MHSSIGLRAYEDIISFEAARAGHIRGFDRDDLLQEMRIHVVRNILPKLNEENTGRTYVRVGVRRALINLRRNAAAASRTPHDSRGRPILRDVPVDFDVFDPAPSPEKEAETRELMRALDVMSEEDRILLYGAFVDGVVSQGSKDKVEDARKRAEVILTNLLKGVQRNQMPRRQRQRQRHLTRGEKTMGEKAESVPECHVGGTDPIGYETDLEDAQDCQDCMDKATCLSDGIKSGLIEATFDIDPEIKTWHAGLITMSDLRKRIDERATLREENQEVPEAMTFDHPPVDQEAIDNAASMPSRGEKMDTENKADKKTGAKKKKAKPSTEEATPEKAPPEKAPPEKAVDSEAPAAKKKASKKPKAAKKKKAKPAEEASTAPKAAKKKKAKPAEEASTAPKGAAKVTKSGMMDRPVCNQKGEKGRFRHSGKPKELSDGRIQLPNGRFIPAPKEITKEKMETSLANLNSKLGLDFDLQVGMKLIQERRKGDNIVVSLKKTGYHLNTLDVIYSSLSGACMAAFVRVVSGVVVFNFTANNNIVVKGKAVPGGSFRKGSEE